MRLIDLDELLQYPLRRGSEHYDEKNADPHFLFGVESVLEYAQTLPTLTQPNNWISVEDRLPEEFEVVLCIVNGRPETNITLRNAYQLGSWDKTEGWIVEEYPVWENAVVSWWQPLPEPPEED